MCVGFTSPDIAANSSMSGRVSARVRLALSPMRISPKVRFSKYVKPGSTSFNPR